MDRQPARFSPLTGGDASVSDCRLIKASSSEEAFTCLTSEKVALVLLALRIPSLEGFKTSRRITAHERFRQTPMIFLSDVALDSEQTFKAYAVGTVDILFRPFDPRLLKAKIVAFIELFKKEGERRRSEKTGAVEINDIPPGQIADEEIAKRKEIEKRWAAQRLLTRALAEAGSLSEATPVLLRTLCENFGWEMGALWLTTRKERPLRCVATWHTPSLQLTEFGGICRKKTFSRNEGLPGRIWDGAAPAWIPDLIRDANFPRKPIAAREGLHATFGFPLRGEEGGLGVLEFFSHEVRQSDPKLLEFFPISAVSSDNSSSDVGRWKRCGSAVRSFDWRPRARIQSSGSGIFLKITSTSVFPRRRGNRSTNFSAALSSSWGGYTMRTTRRWWKPWEGRLRGKRSLIFRLGSTRRTDRPAGISGGPMFSGTPRVDRSGWWG